MENCKTKNQRYFILGGGPLQYDFIKYVKEEGFETHVFDYNPLCIGREIADFFHQVSIDNQEEILRLANLYRPVGIQTVVTEKGAIAASYVAEKLGLCGNTYFSVLNTTDKSRMKRLLSVNGIPTAKYVEIKDVNNIKTKDLSYPLIVKPSDNSGSRGVQMVQNEKELKNAVQYAMGYSNNKIVLIEEYMFGPQISAECISFNGKHKLITTVEQYLTGVGNSFEHQQLMPSRITKEMEDEIKNISFNALSCLNIKYGVSHIEYKYTSDGFKVIEIAARLGAWRNILSKYSIGINLEKHILYNSLGENIPIDNSEYKNDYALLKIIFNKDNYSFYQKMLQNENHKICYKNVKQEFENKNSINLVDAQGYYVIQINPNENIDYYLNSGTKNKIVKIENSLQDFDNN